MKTKSTPVFGTRIGAIAVFLVLYGVGPLTCAQSAHALSSPANGILAPDFAALGADGKQHRLSDYRGSTIILEWTSPACEFTARHYDSGTMQALQRYAAERNVVWLSVDTAAPGRPGYLTADAARQLTKERGATITEFLFDPNGYIGRLYGAKSTPQAYVIDAAGTLVYQGAMDDMPRGDPREGHNYVRAALDEVLAGKPVSTPATRPYGCPIEY